LENLTKNRPQLGLHKRKVVVAASAAALAVAINSAKFGDDQFMGFGMAHA